MYFREYVCRFSRKLHYFCILGVSHLKIETTVLIAAYCRTIDCYMARVVTGKQSSKGNIHFGTYIWPDADVSINVSGNERRLP